MLRYKAWYAAGQGWYGALRCAARLAYNRNKAVGYVLLSLNEWQTVHTADIVLWLVVSGKKGKGERRGGEVEGEELKDEAPGRECFFFAFVPLQQTHVLYYSITLRIERVDASYPY